jgi:hypothetical protein
MENYKKGSTKLVLIIIGVIVIFGIIYYFISGSGGSTSPTVSDNPTASPDVIQRTYTDAALKITFKYPANWKVEKVYRSSNGGQVGVAIIPALASLAAVSPAKRIDVGGFQVTCASLKQSSPAAMCKTVGKTPNYPLYTTSKDPETVQIYNAVAGSIKNI